MTNEVKNNNIGLVFETEKEQLEVPTSLDLWQMSQERVLKIKEYNTALNKFLREYGIIQAAFTSFYEETGQRYLRLEDYEKDLLGQHVLLRSSRSTGLAYLKIEEELSGMGFNPQQTWDFFKTCLKINTAFCETCSAEEKEIGYNLINLRRECGANNAPGSVLSKLIERYVTALPLGCQGSLEVWRGFVKEHACFSVYLNPDVMEKHSGSLYQAEQELRKEQRPGATLNNGYPDWFEAGEIPERVVVEEELRDDEVALGDNLLQIQNIYKQKSRLKVLAGQKHEKVIQRLNEKFESVNSFDQFEKMVLFLGQFKTLVRLRCAINVGRELTLEDQAKIEQFSQQEQQKLLDNIASCCLVYGSEQLLSLQLEQIFKEGALVSGSPGKLPAETFIGAIQDMFLNPEPRGPFLKSLKEGNKKASKALAFKFKPLLGFFEEDDWEELEKELTLLQKDREIPAEPVISWTANLLSLRIEERLRKNVPANREVMQEIVKFTKGWLRKHSGWMYQSLIDKLSSEMTPPALEEIQEEEGGFFSPEAIRDLAEVSVATDLMRKDNLSIEGWTAHYLPSIRDTGERVEITGETTLEKEAVLKQILVETGAHFAGKFSSIINALEWIGEIPENVWHQLPVLEVNGVKYKKFKRDGERILCQRDLNSKKIIFALYHKEDDGYRI